MNELTNSLGPQMTGSLIALLMFLLACILLCGLAVLSKWIGYQEAKARQKAELERDLLHSKSKVIERAIIEGKLDLAMLPFKDNQESPKSFNLLITILLFIIGWHLIKAYIERSKENDTRKEASEIGTK